MTYTYNGEGMLYSAAESGAGRNIRTVYTYDTLGRLIYKDFVKGTTSSLRYSAGYNNKNQLVTRGWATNGLNYQENFTYNSADGTLNTMTIDTDATTGVEHTFQLYYDELRRLQTVGRGVYNFSYTYKDLSDTQTTNQITDLWYTGAAGDIGFHYTYDALGNIATYQEPSGTFTYTYDAQGQLTKAVKGNTTYNYSYDSVGNILTANGHTYTYGNSDWKDLLTAYDGKSITYDGSGNPTSYYNGTRWTFGWTNGRSLTSASNGSTTATYAYNLDGSRSSKTVNGVPHYYLWQDGKPIKEYVDGNSDIFDRYDTLYFLYEENGRPFALIFNGTTYYYVLNLQGDVMRLVDASGTIVAEYTYDPYGNILTATGDLAQINPLRYRGYYFDSELGMYFLNSRYYDPKVGRFINSDEYASTGQGPLGYNMFVYCNNSPVAYSDCEGRKMVCASSDGGGGAVDYVIYYFHPDSTENLDGPAKRNHSDEDSYFTAVSSFDELVKTINSVPGYVDDVYIYLHSDEEDLCFYYNLNYSKGDIQDSFSEIKIYGDIYLFSCKGGRGDLASTIARTTNCNVIASEYKVSFDKNVARCGWWNYFTQKSTYGANAWYNISPDGSKTPHSLIFIRTR